VITLLVRVLNQGHRKHVAFLLAGVILVVVIGAALFGATQHLPFTTGLYWAITTATTVGYGDVTPKNPIGRVVASGVMLTAIPMLAAVFALLTGAATVAGLRRILAMTSPFPSGTFRIVLGSHAAVPVILEDLVKAEEEVVLVADTDPVKVHERVHFVRGDPTQPKAIRAVHPERAQQALVTGESDSDVLVSAVLLRKHAPDLPITALVASASVREALRELGVQQAISAEELVAHTLAKSLETPHAGDLISQLVDSDRCGLIEIEANATTQGKPLSAVRTEHDGLVLGLVQDGRVTLGLGEDPVIAPGDHLLVVERTH
jgi:voltage-gated potassium channel